MDKWMDGFLLIYHVILIKVFNCSFFSPPSSLTGPALQLLSQRVERQLHPASPSASLHPSHGARPHLPSRQSHPLSPGPSPSPSRPAFLPSFRPRRPPAPLPTSCPATRLQSNAPGHQHGHQPGYRPSPAPLSHAAPAGRLQSPVHATLVRNFTCLHQLPAQPHQTAPVPLHLTRTRAHTNPRGPNSSDTLISTNHGSQCI